MSADTLTDKLAALPGATASATDQSQPSTRNTPPTSASVSSDAGGHLSAIASLAPGSVAPWREGRITFDNVPLGAALAEFERYGDTGFVVRDPAVARLRIGGSFSLTQLDRFAAALPQLLPVRITRSGTTSTISLAPKAPAQAPAMQLRQQ